MKLILLLTLSLLSLLTSCSSTTSTKDKETFCDASLWEEDGHPPAQVRNYRAKKPTFLKLDGEIKIVTGVLPKNS